VEESYVNSNSEEQGSDSDILGGKTGESIVTG
jgi:hypothetical protein